MQQPATGVDIQSGVPTVQLCEDSAALSTDEVGIEPRIQVVRTLTDECEAT